MPGRTAWAPPTPGTAQRSAGTAPGVATFSRRAPRAASPAGGDEPVPREDHHQHQAREEKEDTRADTARQLDRLDTLWTQNPRLPPSPSPNDESPAARNALLSTMSAVDRIDGPRLSGLGVRSLAAHHHRRSQRCRCDLLVSPEIELDGNPLRSCRHGPSTARAGAPRLDQGEPRGRPVGRPLPLPRPRRRHPPRRPLGHLEGRRAGRATEAHGSAHGSAQAQLAVPRGGRRLDAQDPGAPRGLDRGHLRELPKEPGTSPARRAAPGRVRHHPYRCVLLTAGAGPEGLRAARRFDGRQRGS